MDGWLENILETQQICRCEWLRIKNTAKKIQIDRKYWNIMLLYYTHNYYKSKKCKHPSHFFPICRKYHLWSYCFLVRLVLSASEAHCPSLDYGSLCFFIDPRDHINILAAKASHLQLDNHYLCLIYWDTTVT